MKPSFAILVLCLLLPAASAGDWPAWRGPTGQGVTDEKDLPLEWDAKSGKNVLWKVVLPGGDGARQDQNQSSPVVVKNKVFLTVSFWPRGVDAKEFPEHHVLCFDAASGKPLWDVKVAPGKWSRASDLRGGYTVPTPAADAERVVVCFGSSVLACLDHSGKQLWRKEITPYQFDVTMASSPVLYKGAAIMQLDGVKGTSRMAAFDLKSGDEKWSVKRPTAGFSHSTPVLATVGKKTHLLVAASNAIQGVDPDDGKLLWWCQSAGDTVSPVMGGGLVYCDGGRGGMGACVDPTGEGDVTKTHRKWKIDRVPEGFSSPVVVSGRLYRLVNPGVMRSWKMSDGEEGAPLRLPGVSTAASPFVTPEGRIYCASAGKSVVVKAGEKPEVLATNDLGDASHASPAVAGGRIYLKGRKYLWCVGRKDEKKR